MGVPFSLFCENFLPSAAVLLHFRTVFIYDICKKGSKYGRIEVQSMQRPFPRSYTCTYLT